MAYRATETTRQVKLQRSAALLDCAGAIVATAGFRAATIKAITSAAAVSAGTFYTYFATRELLLQEVFRDKAAGELDAVRRAVAEADQDNAVEQLSALIETFARRASHGRQLAWALLVEPADELIGAERLEYRRAYAETLATIVTTGIRTGDFADQDARVTGAALVGAIGEALTGPLSPLNHGEFTEDKLVAAILRFCLHAVRA